MPFHAFVVEYAQPVRPTCIGTARGQFMLTLHPMKFEDTRQV